MQARGRTIAAKNGRCQPPSDGPPHRTSRFVWILVQGASNQLNGGPRRALLDALGITEARIEPDAALGKVVARGKPNERASLIEDR